MRLSAQWYRRHRDRFAPRAARHGVAHLKHYSSHYLEAGSGEPLVLVPGLAGGYELAGRLVRTLARRFRVFCFQLRGEHDPVAARRSHCLEDLADDLAEFLDVLGLERPALVGLSFGSAVAIESVLRNPLHRPGVLVLHGLESQYRERLGGRIALQALEQYPLPHDNAFFNQFFRLLFARRESVGPLLDYVTARCWSTDQGVIAHRLRMLARFDVQDRLASLEVPTLVLAGQEDAIVSAARQQEVALHIPGARFVALRRAGHLCFLTRPNEFARQIIRFVGQRPLLPRHAA